MAFAWRPDNDFQSRVASGVYIRAAATAHVTVCRRENMKVSTSRVAQLISDLVGMQQVYFSRR